jgi:hypothetical protein
MQDFGQEAEIKRHLERCRFRLEANTKMDSKEGVDWICLAEDVFQWRTGFHNWQGNYSITELTI